MCILRYHKGLFYPDHGYLEVKGYTNVGRVGSVIDKSSNTRYCVYIGGNLVSWKNKKQHIYLDLVLMLSIEHGRNNMRTTIVHL